jgi:hypothetical protein
MQKHLFRASFGLKLKFFDLGTNFNLNERILFFEFKDGGNYILENPTTKPIIFLENIK